MAIVNSFKLFYVVEETSQKTGSSSRCGAEGEGKAIRLCPLSSPPSITTTAPHIFQLLGSSLQECPVSYVPLWVNHLGRARISTLQPALGKILSSLSKKRVIEGVELPFLYHPHTFWSQQTTPVN